METQHIVLGAWFAAIWFLEAWLPFYDEFRNRREKLGHDGRNLAIGLIGGVITAGFLAVVMPRVAGCPPGGRGLL